MASHEHDNHFRSSWLLLLENPKVLTRRQISMLLTAEKEIKKIIDERLGGSPNLYERILRYRARRNELKRLTTSQLEAMLSDITYCKGKSTPPDLDSDEHIINELLSKRMPSIPRRHAPA